MRNHKITDTKEATLLVAMDFSECAHDALRQAKLLLTGKVSHNLVLHMIDHDFFKECIRHKFGDEGQIKKKAVENDMDMVIIGSCGNTGDISQIFFGSTEEKVLRFITRPVLCVPPESEYRMGR